MAMAMVLGAESPMPCRILPRIMTSRLCANKHTKLAKIKMIKPKYTIGLRPLLSDRGPKNNGPRPSPKNIIMISSWLLAVWVTPKDIPITSKAGSSASIAKATTDIKAAIKAINSN